MLTTKTRSARRFNYRNSSFRVLRFLLRKDRRPSLRRRGRCLLRIVGL